MQPGQDQIWPGSEVAMGKSQHTQQEAVHEIQPTAAYKLPRIRAGAHSRPRESRILGGKQEMQRWEPEPTAECMIPVQKSKPAAKMRTGLRPRLTFDRCSWEDENGRLANATRRGGPTPAHEGC
jgi:hypothetical protein